MNEQALNAQALKDDRQDELTWAVEGRRSELDLTGLEPEALDRAMMRRCLALARQAWGRTAPNPLVGAVVLQGRNIVGEGFHPKAGMPHAEVYALKDAGELAKGATIYVSLEPCNHHGRTPPCSQGLVDAGVGRAIVGMVDPNPKVAGGGIKRLENAGIPVTVGVEEGACQALNEPFVHRIRHGRPFGVLKYAMTLDGKIGTTSGNSAWITDTPARSHVHHLRAGCDAIIVGSNTVRRDNPYLTSHSPSAHNPLRVAMSRQLNLPKTTESGDSLHLWDTTLADTTVLTQTGANPDLQAWLRDQGVTVVELDAVTPNAAMAYLGESGALSVLWECGGTLAARAIAQGAVQKILAFIAPKIVGGTTAPVPVGDLGITTMTKALTLDRMGIQQIGTDWMITGYLPTV